LTALLVPLAVSAVPISDKRDGPNGSNNAMVRSLRIADPVLERSDLLGQARQQVARQMDELAIIENCNAVCDPPGSQGDPARITACNNFCQISSQTAPLL
jgi:hypothetical protein